MSQEVDRIIDEMGEKWGLPHVPRTSVPAFTGGAFSAGHMANEDSRGVGPEGLFYLGRHACYPTPNLVRWLKDRARVSSKRAGGAQ